MAILYDQDETLRQRAASCIADDFKHHAIEKAQDVFYAKRKNLVDQMPHWEDLRDCARDISDHVTENLDYYVARFVECAQEKGYVVHLAPTADDALCEILDIFEEHDATNCVKSKSMMTEEMGLNDILEEATIKVVETDCAENILQTAGDRPSHIVVPALHFDRAAIAKLYHDKEGYGGSSEPEDITHFLRGMLRDEFLSADIGIRGCNFAVAETGSVSLVTNEGNGRMVDSMPDTQIIVVGIDRLVPDLASLDVFMALLCRSAVGSKMTSYFSIDSGPRREGEVDGPTTAHIVLMDNGRSSLIGGDFEPMLRCIRCGACLNACPVYRHITGHGYGSIYPGPMGIVLTTALVGYDNIGTLPYACTLCGACDDDCPVRIPLHTLIRQHRINMVRTGHVAPSERPLFVTAGAVLSHRPLYDLSTTAASFGMKAIARGRGALDNSDGWIPILGNWTESRDFERLAPERFSTLFERRQQINHPARARSDRSSKRPGNNRIGGDVR